MDLNSGSDPELLVHSNPRDAETRGRKKQRERGKMSESEEEKIGGKSLLHPEEGQAKHFKC